MNAEKSSHQLRVEIFMARAGQAVPLTPVMPDEDTRRFRAKIILEETMETIKALGCSVVINQKTMLPEIGEFRYKPDLIEIVDGCADIRVVTTGTLSACGVADHEIQLEVDLNNLGKFGPGSYKREDGKWMKPPTWTPPNIERILQEQAK
jgi:predicted HAD superfamily Cof-like phosphohydrolase